MVAITDVTCLVVPRKDFRDLLGSLDEILQLKHESYDLALAEARASPGADLRLLLPEHQTRVRIETPTAIENAKLQSRLHTRLMATSAYDTLFNFEVTTIRIVQIKDLNYL